MTEAHSLNVKEFLQLDAGSPIGVRHFVTEVLLECVD